MGLVLMTLVIVVSPIHAHAQPSSGPGSPSGKLDSIRRHMERGQALYAFGKYEEAAKVFEQGYREHPYSAFLFNAGVAYQKLGDAQQALRSFREYLKVDPNAPDAEKVRQRISDLQSGQTKPEAATKGGKPKSESASDEMKALLVVETEPSGAPLRIYARKSNEAAAFDASGDNPDWTLVGQQTAPANLTLGVGRYHIEIEKFGDYNASQTDVDVLPGRVIHFKANLSQGEFVGFLRVVSNVAGARVYVDDRKKQMPPWGMTPHGALLAAGRHEVLVEAPGFEPKRQNVELERGEQRELNVTLQRVNYGFLSITGNAALIRVSVDGEAAGEWQSGDPPLQIRLPSGPHRLRLSSPERKTYDGEVEVPRGQIVPVAAELSPRYPRGAAWAQATIGTLFLGTAIYLGVESNRLHGELSDDRRAGVLENDDERITRGRVYAIGADVGFVVSAVMGGLATYNFLRDPYPASKVTVDPPRELGVPRSRQRPVRAKSRAARDSTSSSGVDIRPTVIGTFGGLSVGGRF
jgi:hypothetical protein